MRRFLAASIDETAKDGGGQTHPKQARQKTMPKTETRRKGTIMTICVSSQSIRFLLPSCRHTISLTFVDTFCLIHFIRFGSHLVHLSPVTLSNVSPSMKRILTVGGSIKYHCTAGIQFYKFELSCFTAYKKNVFTLLVKSSLVKLETSFTAILPPTVSVLWSMYMYPVQRFYLPTFGILVDLVVFSIIIYLYFLPR